MRRRVRLQARGRTMRNPPAYRAHERLVAPARAACQPWRLLAGLVLIAVLSFGLNSLLHDLLGTLAPGRWRGSEVLKGNAPGPMLVLLGGFGFVTLATMGVARLLHRRAGAGLIGPPGLALAQFWRVLRLLLVLGALVLVLPPYDMGATLRPNLDPAVWAMLLPLSLVAVLIQVSAEEILFRGYIQQTLAARFSSPLVWMLFPAGLFALGHFVPAEAGANAPVIALWAGLFGVLMADLTARAGTLGPAIAAHLFNNVTALLVVSMPGGLNGLSLYLLPYEMSDTGALRAWLAVDFATMLIAWLAARIAIAR